MSNEEWTTADDEAVRHQAEIGVSTNALTGHGEVGTSRRDQARQLAGRGVELLVRWWDAWPFYPVRLRPKSP
jgi:hypothetical protein